MNKLKIDQNRITTYLSTVSEVYSEFKKLSRIFFRLSQGHYFQEIYLLKVMFVL